MLRRRTSKRLVKKGRKSPTKRRFAIRKSRIDLTQHEGLVRRVVNSRIRRMGTGGSPALRDELMQVGRIGLWQASKRHDPKKSRFSTFATRHVEGAIGRALKRQSVVSVGEREVRRRGKAGLELPKIASIKAAAHLEGASGIDRVETKLRVRKLLSLLPKREREIMKASATMSQRQLGARFKLSPTRVNQILSGARKRLRAAEAA